MTDWYNLNQNENVSKKDKPKLHFRKDESGISEKGMNSQY